MTRSTIAQGRLYDFGLVRLQRLLPHHFRNVTVQRIELHVQFKQQIKNNRERRVHNQISAPANAEEFGDG